MADGIFLKSGGGVTSDDVTAERRHILRGKTSITRDSNDEVVYGTMPDNSIRIGPRSVHGVSSSRSDVPTRRASSMFFSQPVGASGNLTSKVLNMCPPEGYYPGNELSFINRQASEFGNAVAGQVLSGATFTSENGINIAGTVPGWLPSLSGWSDVVYAWNDEAKSGDDIHGNRGIYTKIPNGHYINGANWVFAPQPNLRPENIRAGVTIAGMTGTMPDYSTGRVVFNGATFDGVLVSGVADRSTRFGDNIDSIEIRGLTYNSYSNTPYVFRFKPHHSTFGYRSDRAYTLEGIHSGGLAIRVEKTGYDYTGLKAAYIMKESIDLTPFRTIKVGYKMINLYSNSSRQSQEDYETGFAASYLKAAVCVGSISSIGKSAHAGEDNAEILSGGRMAENAHYFERRTMLNVPNDSQQYLHLDVDDMNGPHFLMIAAAADGHANPRGTVIFNHIELIN